MTTEEKTGLSFDRRRFIFRSAAVAGAALASAAVSAGQGKGPRGGAMDRQ